MGQFRHSYGKSQLDVAENFERWAWYNDFDIGYSVKDVRMDLGATSLNANDEPKFLWNSWVIPKANYMAWRAFSGGIP
ncbi:hypothetical protein HanPI659440_Chr06g0226381 [Helianthus annuus]|nr:hypothetical protein HanPI659440_Chr06g0226381 [Helianthus annuus]